MQRPLVGERARLPRAPNRPVGPPWAGISHTPPRPMNPKDAPKHFGYDIRRLSTSLPRIHEIQRSAKRRSCMRLTPPKSVESTPRWNEPRAFSPQLAGRPAGGSDFSERCSPPRDVFDRPILLTAWMATLPRRRTVHEVRGSLSKPAIRSKFICTCVANLAV